MNTQDLIDELIIRIKSGEIDVKTGLAVVEQLRVVLAEEEV